MRDQAERLRQLAKQTLDVNTSRSDARVLAVASGKGGVGKTNLIVNLALGLQEMGKKTVIFDADIGMANIDVVLGIVPPYSLTQVIRGQKALQDIMIDGPNGIKILPGTAGVEELVHLNDHQLKNLITEWITLEEKYDYILVDTGAGIHADVLNFLRAADDIVVVLTPEPPSITDAYSLIKVLAQRELKADVHLVVNLATSDEEGLQISRRVIKVVEDFLNLKINFLGIIPHDEKVSAAVKRQKPFILEYPNSQASKGIKNIVQTLLHEVPQKQTGGMKQFLMKVIGFFNS